MSGSEHAFTQASRHVSANAERGVCMPASKRLAGYDVRVASGPIIVVNMRHPPTGKHYTRTSGTTHVSHAVKPVKPTRAVPSHRHEAGVINDEIGSRTEHRARLVSLLDSDLNVQLLPQRLR